MADLPVIRGRGAPFDPPNRFERLHVEADGEVLAALAREEGWEPGEAFPGVPTRFYRDPARSVVTRNRSPDVGFEVSLNPYRGCEHGCVYCYARPGHEYLGFSAGVDFESRIMVKEDAPDLLRATLARPSWVPQPLVLSGVTDPYQPVERTLGLTRRCLEVLADAGHPVSIITKNHLVTRDRDLLAGLAAGDAALVTLSITTLDPGLRRLMEPRTSSPRRRLQAVEALAEAGIPVGVNVAPVIPGLTDHEIPSILRHAAEAGATHAGWVPVRLPGAVAPLFEAWLSEHFPGRAAKILGRIREIRGGRLNDPRFGSRMRGEGPYARQISELFRVAARRHGLDGPRPSLSPDRFVRPEVPHPGDAGGPQLDLF